MPYTPDWLQLSHTCLVAQTQQSANSMSAKVALIYGVGARSGRIIADAFAAKGYKLALASRNLKAADSTANELHMTVDCGDSDAVVQAFTKAKTELGTPTVIVYNGM